MKDSGQSSLEYLLLIAGAVLISVVVLLLLVTDVLPAGNTIIGNSLASYGNIGLNGMGTGPGGGPGCGNFVCEVGEDTSNCSTDCPAVQACGDGVVSGTETCDTLGNVLCSIGETCNASCGACVSGTTPTGLITIFADSAARVTVYDYPNNACNTSVDQWDFPDVVPHAVKNDNGKLVLSSANAPHNYFMFGDDFDSLAKVCNPVLPSPPYDHLTATTSDPYHRPDSFTHQQWLTTIYRVGNTIYGLVHNEYHDPRYLTLPDGSISPCTSGRVFPDNKCWYNSINLATSANGGRSFSTKPNPDLVIAYPNDDWNPFAKPKTHSSGYNPPLYGYMGPSSIIKRVEGGTAYYYSFIQARPIQGGTPGLCLMRTTRLDIPSSWRAWDGTGFNFQFQNPYNTTGPVPVCTYIDQPNLGTLNDSLTYNTYLGKYVMIGVSHKGTPGSCGVYFSTSSDLLTWSPKQQLVDLSTNQPWMAALPFAPCTPANLSNAYSYASIIDHSQLNDPNFEQSGNQPYLYITHFQDNLTQTNPDLRYNRDLIRIPLTICEAGKQAPGCPFPSP